MRHEIISALLGSSVLVVLIPKLWDSVASWRSGRAKKKRNSYQEATEALDRERLRSLDATDALYQALQELRRLGAPGDLVKRLERKGFGIDPEKDP